jgi:hypothetical protein
MEKVFSLTQMVCFNFGPSWTLGSALFWRIVDWCLREGANEFTLAVYGINGAQNRRCADLRKSKSCCNLMMLRSQTQEARRLRLERR